MHSSTNTACARAAGVLDRVMRGGEGVVLPEYAIAMQDDRPDQGTGVEFLPFWPRVAKASREEYRWLGGVAMACGGGQGGDGKSCNIQG